MSTHGPHPARFSFVAGQQSPHRKSVAIDRRSDGISIAMECGHIRECVAHFQYRLGDCHLCMQCGIARASELEEFKGWFDVTGASIVKATGGDA